MVKPTRPYRNVTRGNIVDLFPTLRHKLKPPGERLIHFDEIHNEVYETRRKMQSRRTAVVGVKLNVLVDYHFTRNMGVVVKPLHNL